VGITGKTGEKLQTKYNNALAYGKGAPLQPKKGILLRQVDDALYEVESGVFIKEKKVCKANPVTGHEGP
jgi:hypothetical protein